MISKKVFKLFLFCAVLVALSSLQTRAAEENPLARFSKILPEKVDGFRKSGTDRVTQKNERTDLPDLKVVSRFYRSYKSPILGNNIAELYVSIIQTQSEYDAYSLFSIENAKYSSVDITPTKCEYGIACFTRGYLEFVKGNTVVKIGIADPSTTEKNLTEKEAQEIRAAITKTVNTFAKAISDNLNAGEEEIPAIIKHLPDWENVQGRVSYTRNYEALKYVMGFSLLDSMLSEENVEAVVAKYDNTKLVLIEHNTPQLATDADQRIQQKIAELKSQNKAVPTAYKRVGNYSVFVFDAPDAAAANNLISRIDYGKTVQWLSSDPYENDRANRKYLLAAGGIIITVLKTAGIALLVCFALGGSFGYFVFTRRRRQQAMSTAFSDAGGMLRLNLDEMTAQTNASRLLEK